MGDIFIIKFIQCNILTLTIYITGGKVFKGEKPKHNL